MEASVGRFLDNEIGKRSTRSLADWKHYMADGVVPRQHIQPGSKIYNMISLEISQSGFAKRFQVPWLQQVFDPWRRYKGDLRVEKGRTGALYLISSKEGSFTVCIWNHAFSISSILCAALAYRLYGGGTLVDGN